VALRHDAADRVSPVLQQLLAEVLPGALVLDWRQDGAAHAGRMAADGLVYRFRVDAEGVGYRPAWEGVLQRGWELRSDSFLQLRAPVARMDFRRTRAGGGQKRKCATGYGCGNACISLQKECRIAPRSAIGKGRLRRLQQLAAAGNQSAGKTASQVQASRGAAAAALQKDRTTQRVQKLLERPEIAEFLRTGKLPASANSSTEPGTVREMKPGELAFDPSRFQYKINATATTGEVGSLSGVRKWDPNLSGVMSVWKDPADDKVYVVNGHNRLALANRLGAEAVTVRFLNAATATEARAIGALQNIAEGAGSPMDAAKFFRDTGIKNQQDVEARGLPLGSGQASKGLSLSKLPGDVFNAVVRGDLTVNRGAIIGGSGLDDAKQREVFKMIGSRKAITDQTLQELVEHAAASSQRTQTTMDLFGMSQEAKDNLFTRAKLSAGLKAKIAREKRLFSTVSKAKAATSLTEKGGNVINQEQSAKVAGEASEALGVFERLKSASGPISSALNRAADRVEAGEAEATVRKELERDVFEAVQAELEAVGLRKRPRADSLQERIDALRKQCSTGYGCGSACISLRKECRTTPRSAIGKERMKRLLALAQGEIKPKGIGVPKAAEAATMAADLQGRRTGQAQELRFQRQAARRAKAAQEKQTNPYRPTPQLKEGVTLKPMSIAAGGDTNYDPAVEKRKAAGGLKYYRTQRGGATKQNYFFRDRQAAEHWYADHNAKSDADAEEGTNNRRGNEWQAEYKASYVGNRNLLRDTSDREVLETVESFAAAGTATRGGTATDVRIGGNKHSRPIREGTFANGNASEGSPQPVLTNPGRQDPGLAPKAKEQGLNAQDVTTSKQQAAFARQQQQAAQAAGDQSGAQAWRKEERAVERGRLATAISSNKQSQRSLFGVTEYDETMPLFKEQPASTPSTGGSLAVQSGGGAAARPTTTAPASKPGSVTEALRQTLGALKAADAKQMGMIAEQLFEAGWTIDRRTRYRGMSKDQARDKFKAEFAQKMQAQASSPEAAARSAAMRNRAGASGTVSGALKSALEDMKAQDKRLNDLQKQTIDLRIQAEEQFGGEGGEDPSLGGGRPRRRLGGSRRDADILEARIDALRRKCSTGYGCGSSCISMSKQCRKTPGAGPGQQKMQRILALAAPGNATPAKSPSPAVAPSPRQTARRTPKTDPENLLDMQKRGQESRARIAKIRSTDEQAIAREAKKLGLSDAHLGALSNYTADDKYTAINHYMRTGKAKTQYDQNFNESRDSAAMLKDALTKLPEYRGDTFRGIAIPTADAERMFKVGGVFRDKAFQSTSRDETVAKHFAAGGVTSSKITAVIITYKAGHGGRDVSKLSERADEQEVIVGPPAKFRVLSVTPGPKGKGLQVTVERI
jgi:hypothetical protein